MVFSLIRLIKECQNILYISKFINSDTSDVNAIDEDGNTALMWASILGYVELVELLLQNAVIDIYAQNINDKTALSLAEVNGHENIVKLLRDRGPVKDVQNTAPTTLASDDDACTYVVSGAFNAG
jgi:ankyrin repeat protein